jgi:hypothetical protein
MSREPTIDSEGVKYQRALATQMAGASGLCCLKESNTKKGGAKLNRKTNIESHACALSAARAIARDRDVLPHCIAPAQARPCTRTSVSNWRWSRTARSDNKFASYPLLQQSAELRTMIDEESAFIVRE